MGELVDEKRSQVGVDPLGLIRFQQMKTSMPEEINHLGA